MTIAQGELRGWKDAARAARAALLAAALAGCADEPRPELQRIAFDSDAAWVRGETDSTRLVIEIARTDPQLRFGMMARRSLDPNSGMLFVFDSVRADTAGFWMWRTLIPLDIAFLDSAGVVRSIRQMEPCGALYVEGCPSYAPGVPYWSALEVNHGWFAEHGYGVGTVVRVDSAAP